MSWTYTVAVDDPQAREDDGAGAFYGWGPLHTFHSMLAVEAGIDLASMTDFGGNGSWANLATPLRPLFDLDYAQSDHPTTRYPEVTDFLRSVHTRWSADRFPFDDLPGWMKEIQIATLDKLIIVLEQCVNTGRHVIIV